MNTWVSDRESGRGTCEKLNLGYTKKLRGKEKKSGEKEGEREREREVEREKRERKKEIEEFRWKGRI